jgi:hypothetical protein
MAARRRRKWKRKKSTAKNAKIAAIVRSGGGTNTPSTGTGDAAAAAALAVPASFVLRDKRAPKRKDTPSAKGGKGKGGKGDKKRSRRDGGGSSGPVNEDEVAFDNLDLREFDDI